MIRVQSMTKNI